MKKAWSLESQNVLGYADSRGLMHTTLMTRVGLVAMLGASDLTPPQKKCVEDVLSNVEELAY